MYTHFLSHLSTHGHLGGFHLLPITNNAAINMGVQIFLQDAVFNTFGYISQRRIAWLCNSIIIF